MTRRKIECWVIPPEADAEFVAHMEQVLDLYQRPYDPDCPVVCMDEQPVQLVKETGSVSICPKIQMGVALLRRPPGGFRRAAWQELLDPSKAG